MYTQRQIRDMVDVAISQKEKMAPLSTGKPTEHLQKKLDFWLSFFRELKEDGESILVDMIAIEKDNGRIHNKIKELHLKIQHAKSNKIELAKQQGRIDALLNILKVNSVRVEVLTDMQNINDYAKERVYLIAEAIKELMGELDGEESSVIMGKVDF